MSFDLHCSGKSSFHSHLIKGSEYFNLPDFNADLLRTAIEKNFVSLMKQEYYIILAKYPLSLSKTRIF